MACIRESETRSTFSVAFTIAGYFLFAALPKLLLVFVALIPLQIYRARKEEEALAAKLGINTEHTKPGRGS